MKFVLVTGASSGIGRATAARLLGCGFSVFATVRKSDDGVTLRRDLPSIVPVLMDVSDPGTVKRALGEVRSVVGDAGLFGLVNNAGVGGGGPVEVVPLADLERMLAVNVVGLVRVTQAFLPLVREARGRIVNVGSVSGRVVVPLMGPYAATKHAVEAISDALRQEVRDWDVDVVVVEPGAVKTPMWDHALRMVDEPETTAVDQEGLKLYEDLIEGSRKAFRQRLEEGVSPGDVADVILEAMSEARPKTRYAVGMKAQKVMRLKRLLPDRWMDRLIRRMMFSS